MINKNCVEHWCDVLNEPRPYAFVFLILLSLLLEMVGYLFFWSVIFLTPFFYLIIVFSGLWYGRKSLWLAVFIGGLTVAITCHHLNRIAPDSLLNAGMLCIVSPAV